MKYLHYQLTNVEISKIRMRTIKAFYKKLYENVLGYIKN